jgi:hypothetical protein
VSGEAARVELEPTPIREPLDAFLWQVVQTLHSAVNQGIQALETSEPEVDRRLQDCEEILDLVMRGQVQEWIAA